ncbi:MAG TPA: class II aldolase/adducin family protein [Polyangia bacterium]
MREREARAAVAEISRRMYARGLIAAADGNVSVRLGRDRIAVTPSGLSKGYLTADDIVITDLQGRRLSGKGKPTSEIKMHTFAYAERPDVLAVVHGHPPVTVALALAGVSMAQCVLSESCLVLGAVPTAGYATPSTDEVTASLRPLIAAANAVIMDRHGALTLGRTLEEAYNRMETLEHTAKITHAARVLGPVAPLPEADIEKLRAVARAFGLPEPASGCAECNACPNGRSGGPPAAEDQEGRLLADAIAARLRPRPA